MQCSHVGATKEHKQMGPEWLDTHNGTLETTSKDSTQTYAFFDIPSCFHGKQEAKFGAIANKRLVVSSYGGQIG